MRAHTAQVPAALIVLASAAALLTSRAQPPVDAGSKPDGLGALSGVYDVLVFEADPARGYFHCMARLDHDSVTNAVKTAAQCYDDTGFSDPHAEPRDSLPGEGPDLLPGPHPPPPYNWQPPSEGSGSYDPAWVAGPRLLFSTCFKGLGGSLGPNAIATVEVPSPESQLAGNGDMFGQLNVYPRQGRAQCQAAAPLGQSLLAVDIALHPVDDVNGSGPDSPAPWRTIGDHDFDDDGCPDADELWTVKTAAPQCGDDPYSGLDLTAASSDVSGSYLLVVRVSEADACWNGVFGVPAAPCSGADGSIVPGLYHMCLLDVQQTGKSLAARIYCYIDSASIAVNPQAAVPAGAKTCPPAAAGFCGDGLVGASPPGRSAKPSGPSNFADVDDRHAALSGQLDNANGRLLLSGCIEDRDGAAALGNVYLTLDVDAYTGQGVASVFADETLQNCAAGTPAGSPAQSPASLVRQAPAAQQRDTDGDSCPDRRELADVQQQGGLRDPFDHYDYMNPTGDGLNRVDDILAVVTEYFQDDPAGAPDYTSTTDRTGITGANDWNLGPPNGQQRVDDILFQIKQYFHDC